ncbi:DUF6247 family protein [Nocardia sp. NPDC088792]|uniref:DUF6247 family protein n=1 Tax=Nocardia sp. NPDC088792 TaxID=3364332 RepID=UPI0037F4CF26
MTSSAAVPGPRPYVPDAEPSAIRACLPSDVAAEFDRNWNAMMDRAKSNQDVTVVHRFLARWRIMAAAELADPGSYYRMMAKAEQAVARAAAGEPEDPSGMSADEIRTMISDKLNRR